MELRSVLKLSCLSAVACAAGGCASTAYYQDRAVREAREYLLESKDMHFTTEQREFIKFNKPILLMAPVLDGGTFDVTQYCITWQVPGMTDAVLVYGYGDRRMIGWSPNRILLENFAPWDQNRQTAVEAARQAALNDMYFSLTTAQYNHIRFESPEILNSDFDLMQENPGTLAPDDLKSMIEKKTQFAFVWRFPDDPTRCAVLCGLSEPDLSGWRLNFAAIMALDELKSHVRELQPQITLEAVRFVEVNNQHFDRVPAEGKQEE